MRDEDWRIAEAWQAWKGGQPQMPWPRLSAMIDQWVALLTDEAQCSATSGATGTIVRCSKSPEHSGDHYADLSDGNALGWGEHIDGYGSDDPT